MNKNLEILSKLKNDNRIHYLIILFVSILVVTPVLFNGIPYGSVDFIHHLQISNAFYESLGQGIFFPNWVFQENFGYGAVTVRFYPPLMNYSLAVFRLLTGSWQLSIFAAFAFWSFIGGIGIYIWTRDFLKTGWQAAVAAVLFILAPYHLNQFYNSFMFGEFAALSIMPLCFYFAKKICEREKIADILGFAVSMALLILSNLPQTIICALSLGLYILFYLRKSVLFKQFSRLIFAGFLALTGSAFYWVRLVAEMNLINVSQPNTDPFYDYRNHFLFSNFTLDAQNIWFAYLIFFVLVFISLFVLIVSGKIKSLRQDKHLRYICLIGLMVIFMMLPPSKFIWDNFDFLQKVQFPWRFLSVLTLCTSIIPAYCAEFITFENLKNKRPLILLLVGAMLIFLTFSVKQVIFGAAFLEHGKFATMVEQSVSRQGLNHWLPVWADKKAFADKTKVSTNERRVDIEVWEAEKRVFSVAEGSPAKIRLAILYYPHWKAFINGDPAEVILAQDGAINLELPASASRVELFFTEPRYSLLSRKISIFSTAFMLLLFICQFAVKRKSVIH